MEDAKKVPEIQPVQDIQEMEYTPAQEVEPTYSEQSNPVNDVPEVVYATKETPQEKITKGITGAYTGVATKAREYIEKKRMEKMMLEQQQPQVIRKFDRSTIQAAVPINAPPQSPLIRQQQAQLYAQRMHAPMYEMVTGVGPEPSPMQKLMAFGSGMSVMDKFGGKPPRGKASLSPLQKMMNGSSKSRAALDMAGMFGGRSKGKSPLQKMMFGGKKGSMFGKGKSKFGW